MSPDISFRTVTALALLLGAGPSSGAQQPAPRQGDLLKSPRFTDGTASLSGLDELVRFEEPGAVQWCRSAPAEVPWQEARFREAR